MFEQGVCEEVRRDQLPPDAVIIPSRMVYEIKNFGTIEELYKSRLTAVGNLDWLNQMMIHHIANIRHGSVRTIASTDAIKKWLIWFRDSVQTYVQEDDMSRYITLKPAPEFNLPPDVLLRVLKYLYGLSESRDAWGMKIQNLILNVQKWLSPSLVDKKIEILLFFALTCKILSG